jgi:hypothetical protein
MSATSQVVTTPNSSGGAIAHVNFRVRCETLGHGEDVYLVEKNDTQMQKVRSNSSLAGLILSLNYREILFVIQPLLSTID